MSHTLTSTISSPIPSPHDNAQYTKQSLCLLESHSHSTNLHQLEPYSLKISLFKQFLVGGFFFNNKSKHFVLGTLKNQKTQTISTSSINSIYPACVGIA